MPRRPSVPEQLDIPLVWEHPQDPPAPPPRRSAGGVDRSGRENPWRTRASWASIADAGVTLVLMALAGGVAVTSGAALTTWQLVTSAAAGVLIASFVAVAALWAWRGTLGMLLLGVSFSAPLRFSSSLRVWFLWVAFFFLLGAPFAAGRQVLERTAGAPLNLRSSPAGA